MIKTTKTDFKQKQVFHDTMDVEGKATFSGDVEVDGKLQVNDFTDIKNAKDEDIGTLVDSSIEKINDKLKNYVDLSTSNQYITGTKWFDTFLRIYNSSSKNPTKYYGNIYYINETGQQNFYITSTFSDSESCTLSFKPDGFSFRIDWSSGFRSYNITLHKSYGLTSTEIVTTDIQCNHQTTDMSLVTAQQYRSKTRLNRSNSWCSVLIRITNGSEKYCTSVRLSPYQNMNVIAPFYVMYGTTSSDIALCTGYIDSNRYINLNFDNVPFSTGYSIEVSLLEYGSIYS